MVPTVLIIIGMIFEKKRKEKKTFSQRVHGGGSVMLWAEFGFNGKSQIAFISSKMNSEGYQKVLEEYLLPVASTISDRGWIFQQDNAPIHVSESTKTWIQRKKMRVSDWTACSPDFNPIENLWGIIARRVYANGNQYRNVEELKVSILKVWEEISIEELQRLHNSVLTRIATVATNGGKFIK